MAEDFSPPKFYLFCECNSVRFGQNIQNEISLERSIFADVVAYQYINLNWKLNGSREECIHRSIWGTKTTLAVQKGLTDKGKFFTLQSAGGRGFVQSPLKLKRFSQGDWIKRPKKWKIATQNLMKILFNYPPALPCIWFKAFLKVFLQESSLCWVTVTIDYSVASPQTSFGVRLSLIHFFPTDVC